MELKTVGILVVCSAVSIAILSLVIKILSSKYKYNSSLEMAYDMVVNLNGFLMLTIFLSAFTVFIYFLGCCHEDIWRPYEYSNEFLKVNGAPGTTACIENISGKSMSVRTVSYGTHRGVRTGEITAELFTLSPKEKRCETYGSAAYLSDPTTGILLGFSKL